MSQFAPGRLDLARRRRGLTKAHLAKLMGVTPRALTFYLAGQRMPSSTTVDQVAEALDFPPAFFYAEEIPEPPVDGVSFRALSAMTATQRDKVIGAAAIALQLDDWIRERFNLPAPNVPRLRRDDPEAAAEAVREAWGLGQNRAPNLVHLLEKHGVRVYSLAEDCKEVDAFSFWRDGTPYVFLNTMKTAEHSRMDAAHELGHLVLHAWGGPRGRKAEDEAKAFGSAFLMPRRSVMAEAPRPGNVRQIISAKRKWDVSAMALAYRMAKVGILSDWQARAVYSQLGQLGYRSAEPDARPLARETSQVLAKVFDQLRTEGISRSSVARDLSISLNELNAAIFGLVLTSLRGGEPSSQATARPNLRLA